MTTASPASPARVKRSWRSMDDLMIAEPQVYGYSRGVIGVVDRIVLITIVAFVTAAAAAIFSVMFWFVWVPLFLVVLVLTWRFTPITVAMTRPNLIGSVIAVGLAVVWFAINAPFASQYLVAIRDPGVYALTGIIVADTGNSTMDVSNAAHLTSQVAGLTDALGPFSPYGTDHIQLQGSTGLPAILAIGYWIGGVWGEILINLLVGAVCLIALYGLSRRLMGPYWGLLPSLILGCAMPFVYLSRTTYSELMATLVVVASATWGLSAFRTRRVADFAVAGAFIGAAALTRVDGALSFVGALVGLILILAGIGRTREDDNLRWRVIAFVVGGWVMVLLGMVDLFINEPRYLGDLGALPKQLWGGGAALTVVVVVLAFTRLGVRGIQLGSAARRIAIVVSIGLGAIFIFWWSRPYWLIYHDTTAGAYQEEIAHLQAQDNLPIQPTRSYDEYSLWWFGWSFGWVFVALAAIGLCFWLYWAITRRRPGHTIVLATAAVVALLYMDSIKVTPDQIWAFRRVLPVISTALVISATLFLRWLWHRRGVLRAVAVIGLIGCVVGVALPWGRIFFTVEGSGQAAELSSICDSIGADDLVAYVVDGAPPNYALTVRAGCNVQTVSVGDASTFDWKKLAAEARKDGDKGVAVVTFDEEAVHWTTQPARPTTTTVVRMWSRHLLTTPRTDTISVRSVWVGQLGANGNITFTRP